MNQRIIIIALIFALFNFSFCSNLFFQWRITDQEKIQIEKETLELIKSNVELYRKIYSNFETRMQKLDKDQTLKISRYTHCQKCLDFVKRFRGIKEKYGFNTLIENLKKGICPMGLLPLDQDVCVGYMDKYGYIIMESFFSKFFSGYFFCEKIDLCPVEIPKNYTISDVFAQKLIIREQNNQK